MVSLISQTLALCSIYDEEDTCTGVVYLFVVPVPITNMPPMVGEAAFATTLLLSLFLLSREILTCRNLGKTATDTLAHAVPELLSCMLQVLTPLPSTPQYWTRQS